MFLSQFEDFFFKRNTDLTCIEIECSNTQEQEIYMALLSLYLLAESIDIFEKTCVFADECKDTVGVELGALLLDTCSGFL